MLDDGSPAAAASISLICSNCGYGISIRREPPACPMCQASSWDPGRWRPFTSLDDVTIARAAAVARSAGLEGEGASGVVDEELFGELETELALQPGLEARE
jgi:hypothetical protein